MNDAGKRECLHKVRNDDECSHEGGKNDRTWVSNAWDARDISTVMLEKFRFRRSKNVLVLKRI